MHVTLTRSRRMWFIAFFSILIVSMSHVTAVAWPSMFGFGGDDDSPGRWPGKTVRQCTPDEVNFVYHYFDDSDSESNSSGGSSKDASGSGGDWLKEGTEAYEMAKKLFEYWTKDIGVSGEMAAGLLGNVYEESGGTFNERIHQGGDYFPDMHATVPEGGPDGAGGGLFQFTPYSRYTSSPEFKEGGWDYRKQSDYFFRVEMAPGNVQVYLRNHPEVQTFDRTYTAVPDSSWPNGHKILDDPGAFLTADDAGRAGRAFELGVERPKDPHPERAQYAEEANKVFNKDHVKADTKKLAERIGPNGAAQSASDTLKSLASKVSDALKPYSKIMKKHKDLFASPCIMPDGTLIHDLNEAIAYAQKLCDKKAGRGKKGKSGTRHGGGDPNGVIANPEKLNANTLALAKEVAEEFPEIKTIGGWRANGGVSDDHPAGRAIDIMIPDWQSDKGKDLGTEIRDYVLELDRSCKYKVNYVIWRQHISYPTQSKEGDPMEDRGSPTDNHMDHVHVSVYDEDENLDSHYKCDGSSGDSGGSSSDDSASSSVDSGDAKDGNGAWIVGDSITLGASTVYHDAQLTNGQEHYDSDSSEGGTLPKMKINAWGGHNFDDFGEPTIRKGIQDGTIKKTKYLFVATVTNKEIDKDKFNNLMKDVKEENPDIKIFTFDVGMLKDKPGYTNAYQAVYDHNQKLLQGNELDVDKVIPWDNWVHENPDAMSDFVHPGQKGREELSDKIKRAIAGAPDADAKGKSKAQCGKSKGSSKGGSITVDGDIIVPTDGTLTTLFEMRWGQMHKGIDIANQAGTPEYAMADGVVKLAGPAQGFGQWVVVQADGFIYIYGHMNEILVKQGDNVKVGDEIAKMGSQGESTGNHLHLGIVPGEDVNGEKIDPVKFFNDNGVQMENKQGTVVKAGTGNGKDNHKHESPDHHDDDH